MVMVTHLRLYLASFLKTERNQKLQEDRYWGISSTLERFDGRLVREEYHYRMEMGEEKRTDDVAENHSEKKTLEDHQSSCREQVERARLESLSAYGYFLDSLFLYYGENTKAAEMGTSDG